jgi:hypothetical protein
MCDKYCKIISVENTELYIYIFHDMSEALKFLYFSVHVWDRLVARPTKYISA